MHLESKDIKNYFLEQINQYGLYPLDEGDVIVFETRFLGGRRHYAKLLFEINWPIISLPIILEPPDDDILRNFLFEVANDSIFMEGGKLYLPERYEKLDEWKEWLKRIPSDSKLECKILKAPKNFEKEKLKKAIFEYMGRPALYFIIHLRTATIEN
ncbi:MAG: hypothetical protein N3D20_00835 [Candidatus Pacearchaeota archaeon]|nr:hypothetical protein [Candidatus Pacearchaeota archaeon]